MIAANPNGLNEVTICIKGAGDIATGIANRLFKANFRHIYMLETDHPLAVRRHVAYSEAVYEGQQTVENVTAVWVASAESMERIWTNNQIALLTDPMWRTIADVRPQVVVDAILAKKNIGTTLNEAPLVIGLGPGFSAGKDVHMVVETQRGHDLGRIITDGAAAPNTGVPGNIGGYTGERVLRSPIRGRIITAKEIGAHVVTGEVVAMVDAEPIPATITGTVRGLIRNGLTVTKGLKIGDIDPRPTAVTKCHTISDKSRALGGAVLEAILRVYNR